MCVGMGCRVCVCVVGVKTLVGSGARGGMPRIPCPVFFQKQVHTALKVARAWPALN